MMLSRRHFLAATGAGLLGAAAGRNFAYADEYKEGIEPWQSGVIPVDSYFDDMATDSTDPLDIIWVLALDISASVKSKQGEYDAQLSAFADAIERDDFRESIFGFGGPGSAGIFVVDFDDKSKLQVGGVDFREDDRERFREFADRVRNIPRRGKTGTTSHYAAMENASVCFDMANQRGWTSDRKYVNVMTDGTSTADYNYYYRRILAQRHEAIVSSLVIEPKRSTYVYNSCEENLTTPPYTFPRSGKGFLDGGVTEKVATEMETRGNNISRYQDKTFMIMRNQITTHSARNDFNDNKKTRLAMAEPVSRRRLIIPPELNR